MRRCEANEEEERAIVPFLEGGFLPATMAAVRCFHDVQAVVEASATGQTARYEEEESIEEEPECGCPGVLKS